MLDTSNLIDRAAREQELGAKFSTLDAVRIAKAKVQVQLELNRRAEEQKSGILVPQITESHVALASAYPLRKYIYEAFPHVEAGVVFKNNWHIDAISEFLQAVTVGQIKNFIINIPRRCVKSTLVCVMWPTWTWTFMPHTRWLFTSYDKEFAKRDNEKCQALWDSDWFQARWGSEFQLVTRRRDKITNNKGGFRVVFKIGKGTGEGGQFVIADDPNAIDEVESETILESTNRGWNEVSYHNVTDKQRASRGIIQQRTAPNDLTGNITDDDELKNLYSHLCLAMKYEPDHPYGNSISKPLFLGTASEFDKLQNPKIEVGDPKLWVDPRDIHAPDFDNEWYKDWYKRNFTDVGLKSEGEGQLLWETYMTADIVAQEIAHLKAYGEHSQFQQRPTKRGGNFFHTDNFLVNGKPVPYKSVDWNGFSFCRYWDKAGTEGAGDFTVGMLMARSPKRPFILYIVDVWRKQVGYYERMEKMKELAERDTLDYVESLIDTEYSIGIEREPNASGKDVSVIEKDFLVGYDVFIDRPKGKKSFRAKPAKSYSEAGRIKIIQGNWNATFIKNLEKFNPDKDSQADDEIDTLSGAFKKLIFGARFDDGGGFGGGRY